MRGGYVGSRLISASDSRDIMSIILTTNDDLRALIESSITTVLEKTRVTANVVSPPPEWVSNRDALDLTGLSRSSLARYRKNGQLPYSKVGNNVFYRRADLLALFEDNMVA